MKLSPASSPLKGSLPIPGDKSVSHRAVMFGALAEGDTEITNFLMGADCLSTIACFRAMGVDIDVSEDRVTVHGAGLGGLHAPEGPLDCGNSGTTMRLIMGILSAQPFATTLTGDDSLRTRPMGRVATPLAQMGAGITSAEEAYGSTNAPGQSQKPTADSSDLQTAGDAAASGQVSAPAQLSGLPSLREGDSAASGMTNTPVHNNGKLLAPLRIRPVCQAFASNEPAAAHAEPSEGSAQAGSPIPENAARLHGITYESPVASAQVKSAILLAGLYADSPTTVIEPAKSRDHTERMLSAFGAKLETGMWDMDAGVSLRPYSRIYPCEQLTGQRIHVPGDISSAAYFLAAASLVPGSEVLLKNVGINPTRDGFLRVLKAMGGDFELLNEHDEGGEPCADILVRYAPLHGTKVCGEIIPALIDELPMVAVMAACAEGETIVADASELAVKESNRIETVARGLQAMGAQIEARPDGWVIRGLGSRMGQSSPSGSPNVEDSDNTSNRNGSNAKLKGALIDSHNDHRIAMSFAIAALAAEGPTEIRNADCIKISYPAFFSDLTSLMK